MYHSTLGLRVMMKKKGWRVIEKKKRRGTCVATVFLEKSSHQELFCPGALPGTSIQLSFTHFIHTFSSENSGSQ